MNAIGGFLKSGSGFAEILSFLKSRIQNSKFKILGGYFFLAVASLISASTALADDVGITKARLIQKSEKSYVLEADGILTSTKILVYKEIK